MKPGIRGMRRPIIIVTMASIAFGLLLALSAFYDSRRLADLNTAAPQVPSFSLPAGRYESSIGLEIAPPPLPGAKTIFTTDGRLPLPGQASEYVQPIRLSAETPGVTVVRARTLLPDGRLSEPVNASYAVGLKRGLPILSMVVEPSDLRDDEVGIYANYEAVGRAWERPAHVDFLDDEDGLRFATDLGIRIHGQASKGYPKKSFRLYFRDEYGEGRLDYPLFDDNPVTSFNRLVLHSGGQDTSYYSANWTLMRTQLMASLARDVDAYTTYNRPALLFINGELWGIYLVRERIDDDFFRDHYGLEGVDVVETPIRNQDRTPPAEEWRRLVDYATTNDMADPQHYDVVLSQIDVDNFIDTTILQMYAANNDWPFNNEHMFRPQNPLGRWQWILWDVDYSFGMLPASTVDFNMVNWLMTPDRPEIIASTRFFRALWQNVDFRNRFLVRSAFLLNTTLAPDRVLEKIEKAETDIRPGIDYEIARWSAPGNWETSVQELKSFAQLRPDIMRRHYVDGFGLSGTAEIAVDVPASGRGTVHIAGAPLPSLPFTGTFFTGTTLLLQAIPEDGYELAGWDVNGERIQATAEQLAYEVVGDGTVAPAFERVPASD